MLVGSYVVKTDDIRDLMEQIDGLKPPAATLDYKKDLLDRLREPEFRRIKWFFYCDDKDGNTIRVFDSRFLQQYGRLFREKHLLLRGEKLGSKGEDLKRRVLSLFREVREDY